MITYDGAFRIQQTQPLVYASGYSQTPQYQKMIPVVPMVRPAQSVVQSVQSVQTFQQPTFQPPVQTQIITTQTAPQPQGNCGSCDIHCPKPEIEVVEVRTHIRPVQRQQSRPCCHHINIHNHCCGGGGGHNNNHHGCGNNHGSAMNVTHHKCSRCFGSCHRSRSCA